ncbi:MAG: protein kinase [Actinomycetota bacterium]
MEVRPVVRVLRASDPGAGSGGGYTPAPGQPAGGGMIPSNAEAGMMLGGRYRLLSPIASGGMAQVWRAQDTSLVRQVAVKILHPHLATDQAFVSRFRREAVASARLSHPSIVAVYDTLSEGGVEAIVMELIEGRTLREVLNEAGVLPPADVVDVGMQISDALDEAHRAGIVHRDIKPANIMVGADRRVMVTDFGIAKANKDADLTHTGTLLGTAKYLAPEQVAGEPVDPRADIYALGIVLFEAATGQPPFLAETDAGTALARLQGEVPRTRSRNSAVPVGLDAVIARSMARDPDQRFDRASTFKQALAAADLNPSNVNTMAVPTTNPGVNPGVADANLATMPPPTGAPSPGTFSGQGQAPVAPHPGVANPGTAILTQMPDGDGTGGAGNRKPGRRQRRAAKKAAAAAPAAGGGNRAGAGANTGRNNPRPGRQRPTKTILAGLMIGGLVVVGLLIASTADSGEAGDTDDPTAAPVIIDAIPFDPFGEGTERNSLAVRAIDGDVDSAWTTEGYTRPSLGGLKEGVGFVLTLEQSTTVDQLELLTDSDGWDAQFYVGEDFAPNDRSFDVASLGEPLAVVSDGGAGATVSLGGATGSKILIWITETGPSPFDESSRWRFVLNEARVS